MMNIKPLYREYEYSAATPKAERQKLQDQACQELRSISNNPDAAVDIEEPKLMPYGAYRVRVTQRSER